MNAMYNALLIIGLVVSLGAEQIEVQAVGILMAGIAVFFLNCRGW